MTGKLAASLFCLLFAIPFGLGGGFAIYSMTVHLGGWIETRSWQPVMAEVLEVRLNESRSRKSTTYRVEARYRYDANGVSHTGSRVGYTAMGDNVGSWQEDIYRELDGARGSGRKVLAWADPDQPAASSSSCCFQRSRSSRLPRSRSTQVISIVCEALCRKQPTRRRWQA